MLTDLLEARSELTTKLSRLVSEEHQATYEIVEALTEMELPSYHLSAGYRSLFSYCTIALGYSEPAAIRRVRASRFLRRYPQAKKLFHERKLGLTTICLLSEVINEQNADELIDGAAGKSRTEAARLVERHRPMRTPEMRDEMRAVFIEKHEKKQLPLEALDETGLKPAPRKRLAATKNRVSL